MSRSWARFKNDSTTQAVANNTNTYVTYNQTFEKGGSSVFTEKTGTGVIVPSGVTAVRAHWRGSLTALNATALCQAIIIVNRTSAVAFKTAYTLSGGDQYISLTSPVFPVSTSDEIEARVYQVGGGSEDLNSLVPSVLFVEDMTGLNFAHRAGNGTPQSISGSTATTVTFGGSTTTSGSADFTTGAPSNGFIIPSGVTHVELAAGGTFTNPDAARIDILIRKIADGNERVWRTTSSPSGSVNYQGDVSSGPIEVSAGDTFDVRVYHTAGTAKNFTASPVGGFSILDRTGEFA